MSWHGVVSLQGNIKNTYGAALGVGSTGCSPMMLGFNEVLPHGNKNSWETLDALEIYLEQLSCQLKVISSFESPLGKIVYPNVNHLAD